MQKKRKRKLNWKRIFSLLIIIGIIAGTCTFLLSKKPLEKAKGKEAEEPNQTVQKPIKKVQIIDENSTSRPYAVMINNHHDAWPHAGLQDAYLTYEIIVEGGITRMMALFKDQDTTKIGSVRSSRHYFLDYALENDAIYAHIGWSPEAQADIAKLDVDNINGLYQDAFFRDKTLNKAYEHTAFTSISNLAADAKALGYQTSTSKGSLFRYQAEPLDLPNRENSKIANQIELKYSNYHTTSYVYDQTNKVYLRSMGGKPHVDAVTGKQYTAKNIITYQVENYSIDDYGRQDIKNIGSGEGYYISEGYAIPITWKKTSRTSRTIYQTMDGKELVLNDGNTFIQIQPKNQTRTITE